MLWHRPVPPSCFTPTRAWMARNEIDYPVTKVHPGVDYPPLPDRPTSVYACADGYIAHVGLKDAGLGVALGNFIVVYVPIVGRSFLYCHLLDPTRECRAVHAGEPIGVMGNTGSVHGVHLHLEGFGGRFVSDSQRSLATVRDVETKTFDVHAYLTRQLATSSTSEAALRSRLYY